MHPSASAFVPSAPLSSTIAASSFVQAGGFRDQLASPPCVVVSPSRSRAQLRMVTVSRPSFKSFRDGADNDGGLHSDTAVVDVKSVEAPSAPTAPEVAAVAVAVCEFMNTERVRDIANYVVRFGRKFDDLSQLSQVKMTALDAAGFTADIVSCDESSCVCVQERFDWPMGLCTNAADVINALKHLSMACGLPADF